VNTASSVSAAAVVAHLGVPMVLGGTRTRQAIPQEEGVQLLRALRPRCAARCHVHPLLLLLLLVVLVMLCSAFPEPQPGGVDQVRQLVKVKGQWVVVTEQDNAVARLGILEEVRACTSATAGGHHT
jgi:hypothetical protein